MGPDGVAPSKRDRLSFSGSGLMRMASIASFVAMPHVIDRRFRMLAFHPERGDQGVLRRYGDASPHAGDVHANREFEHHSRISLSGFLKHAARADRRVQGRMQIVVEARLEKLIWARPATPKHGRELAQRKRSDRRCGFARPLIRRHSPLKDGRLSTPYRATFSRKRPQAGEGESTPLYPFFPAGWRGNLLRKPSALGTHLAALCACRRP
jgi:hypothetical protein